MFRSSICATVPPLPHQKASISTMSRNIYLDSTQRLRLHSQETQSALLKRHNEKTMKYRLNFIKQQCILTVTFKKNYLTGKSVLILVTNEEQHACFVL